MTFFWKKKQTPKDTSLKLLSDILQKGSKDEIEDLLWQPKTANVDYLPITFDMMLNLKRPETSTEKLSIHKTQSNKNFTLIIFNIPWKKDKFSFSPLIIENSTSKIVGVMLPFNELHQLLSKQQDKEISELGMIWTMFAIEKQFA
ncbi:MAG TPA: hypothetical protein VKB95_16910 [Chitinophagaceae bacterium]|nr:hypothetical protein [Chitinophagaceae bacterium]